MPPGASATGERISRQLNQSGPRRAELFHHRSMGTAETAPDKESRRTQVRRAAMGSAVGTTIEWYDFFLYGTAAALVFPHAVLPRVDPYTGTLLSFATYAVGFVARPVGRRSSATGATGSAARSTLDHHAAGDGHRHRPRSASCPGTRRSASGAADLVIAAAGAGIASAASGRLGAARGGVGRQAGAGCRQLARRSARRSGWCSPPAACRCCRDAVTRGVQSGAGGCRSLPAWCWSAIGLLIRLGILEPPCSPGCLPRGRRHAPR